MGVQDDPRKANLTTKTPKYSPTSPQDDHKEAPRKAQGTSWGYLGASWEGVGEAFEASWEPLGSILNDFLKFGAKCENSKKH